MKNHKLDLENLAQGGLNFLLGEFDVGETDLQIFGGISHLKADKRIKEISFAPVYLDVYDGVYSGGEVPNFDNCFIVDTKFREELDLETFEELMFRYFPGIKEGWINNNKRTELYQEAYFDIFEEGGSNYRANISMASEENQGRYCNGSEILLPLRGLRNSYSFTFEPLGFNQEFQGRVERLNELLREEFPKDHVAKYLLEGE